MRFWSVITVITLVFGVAVSDIRSEVDIIESVRIGEKKVSPGESVPDAEPPELIHRATPNYPIRAKQLGDTGTAWLRVCVGAEGDVVDVVLAKPSGSRSLDRAALRTAYKNEFQPAIYDGQPVRFWVQQAVAFGLAGGGKPSIDDSVAVGIDPENYRSVSGEFSPADVDPEMTHQVLPKYPSEAKQEGIAGKVWVSVLVDELGEVRESKVSESSGSSLLDEAALEAADKNKYKPGIQRGCPAEVWVTYPVEFTLTEVEKASSHGQPQAKRDSGDTLPSPDELVSADTIRDELVQVEIMPEAIHQVSPVYPLQARHAGITGTVSIKALVDEEGKVLQAIVDKSSGTASLDEAAVAAAYEFKYKPGMQEGLPVKAWVSYPVEFTLADEGKIAAGGSTEVEVRSEDSIPPPDELVSADTLHDEFVQVEIMPEAIHQVSPVYPLQARHAGITGMVSIKALVDQKGKVLQAIVDKSSGTASLDEAAVAAAYEFKYKPGIQNGLPVKVWVTYPVEFTLADMGKPSAGDSTEVEVDSEDSIPPPDESVSADTIRDGFVQVEIMPEVIHQVSPMYPLQARHAGITGTVSIKALVDEEGKVLKAIVDKSSGTASLDEAAVAAAYEFKYKPGIRDGRPVKVWVTYPVEFKLDGK